MSFWTRETTGYERGRHERRPLAHRSLGAPWIVRVGTAELAGRNRGVVVHQVVGVLPEHDTAVQRPDIFSADHAVAVAIEPVELSDEEILGEHPRRHGCLVAR